MWKIIYKISNIWKKSSILLSTHSMEEAEALSNTIGILVNGTFRCLGGSQVIKDKFAIGYQLLIKIKNIPQDKVAQIVEQFGFMFSNIYIVYSILYIIYIDIYHIHYIDTTLDKAGIHRILERLEVEELYSEIEDGKAGAELQRIVYIYIYNLPNIGFNMGRNLNNKGNKLYFIAQGRIYNFE